MLHRNIASRYANALFNLANEQGRLEAVERDFPRIAGQIEQNKDLHDFLTHPTIQATEKLKAVAEMLQGASNEMLYDFMSLVVDKNREAYIPLMWEVFHELLMEHRKQVEAVVDTPYPLPEELQNALRQQLGRVTGKTILLRQQTDPELIGGIRVRLGDRIIDGSVVFGLKKMKEALKAVKV